MPHPVIATQPSGKGPAGGLAIGLMLLAMFLFSLNDVLGKWLVGAYAPAQILLIRSLAALAVLLPMMRWAGLVGALRAERLGLHIFRGACSAADVLCFYTAVKYLPLADVMAFYLAAPIFVAAMSPFLLREKVGWRRWTGILVGFAGVVVALAPSSASLELPAILSLCGAFAFSLLLVATRALGAADDKVLVLWPIAGALVVGIVGAPFAWAPPTALDLALLGLLGLVSMGAYFCVNGSLKLSPAASVAPYQYTLIVWAIVFGYPVFGDVPSLHMLAGAALIVAAGLFILWREQVVQRGRPPDPRSR